MCIAQTKIIMKIPRRKKKQIPRGTPYCYTSSGWGHQEEGGLYLKIKSCPYYIHESGVDGYCKLLRCEIIDQVKDCGVSDR